jgi:hypothetical protein
MKPAMLLISRLFDRRLSRANVPSACKRRSGHVKVKQYSRLSKHRYIRRCERPIDVDDAHTRAI